MLRFALALVRPPYFMETPPMSDTRRPRPAPPRASTPPGTVAPSATAPAEPAPAAPAVSTSVAPIPTRADISEAVRKTPVGMLSDEAREMIRQRRERNLTVANVKAATWAKESMSHDGAMALINYCHEVGIDPMTEVDVLGGKVYVNATYAIRRLSELQHGGRIHDYRIEWIHHDQRLVDLSNGDESDEETLWARGELRKRARERIERNVPDAATSAAVCRIWLVGMESTPAIGTKWHQQGRTITRKSREGGTYEKDADPVGDQFPMETLETRAIRRAMRMLAKEAPDIADALIDGDRKAATVNAKLADDRQKTRADADRFPLGVHQLPTPDGAYSDASDTLRRITTGAPARDRAAQVAPAELADPYALDDIDDVSVDDDASDGEQDQSVPVPAAPARANSAALNTIGDAELADMLEAARDVGNDKMVDAIEQELEARRIDRDGVDQ